MCQNWAPGGCVRGFLLPPSAFSGLLHSTLVKISLVEACTSLWAQDVLYLHGLASLARQGDALTIPEVGDFCMISLHCLYVTSLNLFPGATQKFCLTVFPASWTVDDLFLPLNSFISSHK